MMCVQIVTSACENNKTHKKKKCTPPTEPPSCVTVITKYDEEPHTWYYDVPPTPFRAVTTNTTCTDTDKLTFHTPERPGYYDITVYLSDADGKPLAVGEDDALVTAFEVTTKTASQEDFDNAKRRATQLDAATTSTYAAANPSRAPWRTPSSFDASAVEWVEPELADAALRGDGAALRKLATPLGKGVWAVQLFRPNATAALKADLHAALAAVRDGSIKVEAPNSMNRYGAWLRDLGYGDLAGELARFVLKPLAASLLPQYGAFTVDGAHAFAISYAVGEDVDLDRHMDESEVTVNVCLSDSTEYQGADLYFGSIRDDPNDRNRHEEEVWRMAHRAGVAVIHAGQHWHGVDRLTHGRRSNFVVWLTSKRYRSSAFEAYADAVTRAARVSSAVNINHSIENTKLEEQFKTEFK
ncbi:2-oxoglutarate and iron-dependent oxygenase domain-containing protein 2 [Pseudoscourfieldia marina]